MTIILLFLIFGISKVNLSSLSPKIVGGHRVTKLEDFNYQVAIVRDRTNFCGGSIINEKNILTASHCLVLSDDRVAKAASLDIYGSMYDLYIGTKLEPQFVFTHPDFSFKTMRADIAVIRVKKINFTPTLHAVNMPTAPILQGFCNVSGWGANTPTGHVVPTLHFVTVPIYPRSLCYNGLPSGMICAGYQEGQKDACYGDSGGPLVCNGVLTGVVSWGRSCAQKDSPGVYADVYYYRKWIQKQIERSSSSILDRNSAVISLVVLNVFSLFYQYNL